ncbi:MAG: flap endonuclease Xni [bacterium]|nr:flap endonuclease Xni [bacterium]
MTDEGQRRPVLLLVDALNLIRRVYAAQPGEDGPERSEGARVSSVQSLRRGLRESAPTHAVCVFDGEGRSWRHELYPAYKAGHAPMPDALGAALEGYREAFRELGVASLCRPRLEADDVIATIACKAVAAGASAIILSTDKTFLGLLPHGVQVRDHFRGADLDVRDVIEKFGVRPEQLGDFLALAGDRGNNINGVPGIGPKTAGELLSRFETLEDTLQAASDLEGKLGERLRDHAATARLCRTLVGLRTDLALGTNLSELRYLSSDMQGRNRLQNH